MYFKHCDWVVRYNIVSKSCSIFVQFSLKSRSFSYKLKVWISVLLRNTRSEFHQNFVKFFHELNQCRIFLKFLTTNFKQTYVTISLIVVCVREFRCLNVFIIRLAIDLHEFMMIRCLKKHWTNVLCERIIFIFFVRKEKKN